MISSWYIILDCIMLPKTCFKGHQTMSRRNSGVISNLISKKWFGFDLDDTLHEFRKASTQASLDVFEAIHAKHGIEVDTLRATYQQVLRGATANAFTDGRTSSEYRRERFSQLLRVHGVIASADDNQIDLLLDIYKLSLQSRLTLKSGALSLLQTLRRLGKKIIVVTEGPIDAQEWTVRQLGLWPFVDILVTTNEMGRSKVDGLFPVVLEKYGIGVDEIVYFGDNQVRDVEAAQRSGLPAVLYDEEQEMRLDDLNALRVRSWAELQELLVNVRIDRVSCQNHF